MRGEFDVAVLFDATTAFNGEGMGLGNVDDVDTKEGERVGEEREGDG